MSGIKISALPSAALPLSGNEVTPIVQSGDTVQVALKNMFAASTGSSQVGFINSGTGAVLRTSQAKMRDVVDVKDFGAVGDGVTDDTAAINAALSSISGYGGTVIIGNGMRCKVNSDINIPINCALEGSKSPIGIISPPAFDSMGCAIYLAGGASIRLDNAAQLRKLLILRQGMTWTMTSAQVAAQYVGNAVVIKDATSDTVIDECTIIGFACGIRSVAGATNVSRVRIRRVGIDCITGILLENSYDICYLDEVHCWPYGTVNSAVEPQNAQLKRSGDGIQLTGVNDWTKVTDCFTYGYAVGMHAAGGDSITFLNCGNDHPPTTVSDGSIGFLIDGDSFECRIIGGQVAAKANGIYINTTATAGSTTVSSCNVWETRANAIVCQQGTALITDAVLRNTGGVNAGILVYSTITSAHIIGGSIQGFSVGITSTAATAKVYHSGVDFIGTTTLVSNPYKATVASADPLPLDGNSLVFEVTGTSNFGTINPASAYAGKTVTLKFTNVLTVIDGGASLKLNGNFVTTADDTLTLISDGTAWYEVARSVN